MQWGNWLQHRDERILEYLAANGESTAWEVAFDIDRTRRSIARRCRELAEAEFVERVERDGLEDRWVISTGVVQYLAGEFGVDHRRPVPGMRPGGRIRPSWCTGSQNA